MKFRNIATRMTMFIFGFLAIVLSVVGLKDPKALLRQIGFIAVKTPCAPGRVHKLFI